VATFTFSQNLNETLNGTGEDDEFFAGADFTAFDRAFGGAGFDTLHLAGNYAGGVTFAADTLQSIEKIAVSAGYSYRLVTHDANVAAADTLTVDASALERGSGRSLYFDGSAETDGSFHLIGSGERDTLITGAGNDTIDISKGKPDTVSAGGGNDAIVAGAGWCVDDRINGGSGHDVLVLNGDFPRVAPNGQNVAPDYALGLVLANESLQNVEEIRVLAGHDVKWWFANGNVGAGQTMLVDGTAMGVDDDLFVNGCLEKDGFFVMHGGAGDDTFHGGWNADTITGGAGDDMIHGRRGADTLDGGTGIDTAGYTSSAAGVTVDLALTGAQVSAGDATGDVLSNFENLYGTAFADTLMGDGGDNKLRGEEGDDVLIGRGGNDHLIGREGNDTLIGGAGADRLEGGAGNDTFVFSNLLDSGVVGTARDRIVDFEVGDHIDLSGVATEAGVGFEFIEGAAFSGVAGQVRQYAAGASTVIAGDIDGDCRADFQINVAGAVTLQDSDFIL
jgi:Ca2+-binding RTX toxin-like protein